MIPPDDAVREAASKLAHAVSEYRLAHDTRGGASLAAGRAWDEMRRAEQAVYAALAGVAGGGAKGTRCWDVDLCCGDDLCRFQNGESLPRGVYCAKDTPPAPLDAQDHGGKCPGCRGPLVAVTNDTGWMNDEQFDSQRAGDFYCAKCPPNDRSSKNTRCYWWKAEVNAPPVSPVAPASKQVAQAAHGKGEVVAWWARNPTVFDQGIVTFKSAYADSLARDGYRVVPLYASPALAGATGASVEEVARVLHEAASAEVVPIFQGVVAVPWDEVRGSTRNTMKRIARAVLARLGATGEGK